jgi:aspartyl-tRNA(Asn)/glutamyl-tRNA(Gln) amidotransferase subunit A
MRSAADIAAAVRRREVSPVEFARRALERAEDWQPRINAFSQLRPEETLREATDRERAVARGRDPGPLAGVPVAVKDLFDVEGWETTGCCAAFRGRVADRDSEAVRRLRAAGAVVVGKTNQHELAAGATNLVSACGPTHNPWDLERITGGSSGGSAALVAVGVAPIALGSDTGGSIRIPASMCGVTGLKPTTGSVSLVGAMPLSRTMDAAGPLSRTVADAELVLRALREEPVPDARRGMTVAVLTEGYGTVAREDVLAATREVGEELARGGAVVVEGRVEGIDDALEVWERIAWSELSETYPSLSETKTVHARTRELLRFGERSRAGLAAAKLRAEAIGDAFRDALRGADALLLPSTPFPAPRADERVIGSLGLDMRTGAPSVLTRPVNLAGLPALSLPAGFDSEGMPIGVQLVGRADEDGSLLALASRYQGRTEHHLRAPRDGG